MRRHIKTCCSTFHPRFQALKRAKAYLGVIKNQMARLYELYREAASCREASHAEAQFHLAKQRRLKEIANRNHGNILHGAQWPEPEAPLNLPRAILTLMAALALACAVNFIFGPFSL